MRRLIATVAVGFALLPVASTPAPARHAQMWTQTRIVDAHLYSSSFGIVAKDVCRIGRNVYRCHERILKTLDGGRSWIEITPTGWNSHGAGRLSSEQFLTRSAGWVVNGGSPAIQRGSAIYRTKDGGESWHSSPVPPAAAHAG